MAFLFTPTNLSSHPAGAGISYKKLIDDDHRDLSGLTDVEKVSFELATWTFKFHNGYDNRRVKVSHLGTELPAGGGVGMG
jgi:hypothetical protein